MPINQTALITGASAGLGQLFAEKLAARGYDLIITARRQDRLDEIAKQITETHGVKVDTLSADLSAYDDIRTVEEKIRTTENLTLLINNAGFAVPGYFHEINVHDNIDMCRVHIEATMRFCSAALPGMIERKQGNIINVSSVASFIPVPKGTTYCATKAYLTMFSECLNMESSPHGVHVQALCPGFTRTEFHKAAEYSDEELSQIPGWMWLDAEDVINESLRAMDKGKCVVVPGKRYRFILFLFRLPVIGSILKNSTRKRRR
ncbi:MAG: SDR family oxidoreductase [candidate division Zixibacteria bacterium]|nr:SDR family oxidoreductase [candidate division Zixibacteria bacterium]